MKEYDLSAIKYFSKDEIEATGAKLEDIQRNLIHCLDTLRAKIERRIKLLRNGLTSGSHKAKEHPQGLAADFYLEESDGEIEPEVIFKACLEVGFKGIGIYWNGRLFSFHVDLREHYGFWIGSKTPNESKWTYSKLIKNPKQEA